MILEIKVEVMENGYLITATQSEPGGQYKDRIEKKYVAYNGQHLDDKIAELKGEPTSAADEVPF